MFSKSVSIGLIFLLLVNVFATGLLKVTYLANKAYFTENFCVNKAKPKLKCEGKCHLNKTIKKIEKDKGQSDGKINLNMAFEFLCFDNETFYLNPIGISAIENAENLFFTTSLMVKNLIKPPIQA